MVNFLFFLLVTAHLAVPVQQEAAPPTPSVVDAAKAARERQSSSKPKHVLTDDDVTPGHGAADSAAAAGNEVQVRAQMEKSFPANPTAADLKGQITQIDIYSRYSAADLAAKFKSAAVYGYEKVDFPGKKEWEEQVDTAANHFVDEAGKVVPRLKAILDQNQDALAAHDRAASQKVRTQWIEAVVAYASWQMRLQRLIEDGQSRAKAYLANSSAAFGDYRRSRAKQAESTVGWTLISLREEELEFKKNHARYTCDLTDFNFNATNPNKPQNYKIGWDSKMDVVRTLGYHILMQGCDSEHFTALAVPPAPDGSQGRALCNSESGGIRIADDGGSVNCLSNGRDWHGE